MLKNQNFARFVTSGFNSILGYFELHFHFFFRVAAIAWLISFVRDPNLSASSSYNNIFCRLPLRDVLLEVHAAPVKFFFLIVRKLDD